MQIENEFIHLDGGKHLLELVDQFDRTDTVVIEYQGQRWVFSGDELLRFQTHGIDPVGGIGETLQERYPPALTTSPDSPYWTWGADRVVFVDAEGAVVGVAIERSLEESPPTEMGPSRGSEPKDDGVGAAVPPPSADPPKQEQAPPEAEGGPDAGRRKPRRKQRSRQQMRRGRRSGRRKREPPEEPWNLQTHFPREVTVGSVTSLVVELTREAIDDQDTSILPVDLAEGTEVSVVVQAKRGFRIEGPAEGRLEAGGESASLRFQLRATTVGTGLVRVLFFVEATALGAITLEPVIQAPDARPDPTAVASSEVVSALSVGSNRPDLELLVLEEGSDGRPRYSIRVTAADEALGIHMREFGPIELHTDARAFFAETFTDIEKLDLATSENRERAQRMLETKGAYLFSTLLPEPLQSLLWQIRSQITRIRIDSEEPYIPWELIRLSGPDEDGTVQEDRFLCEYELTRWIPGYGLRSRLSLADFGVVIPDDSGLASAQEEKVFLTGLATPGRRKVTAVPPTFEELTEALAAGVHDVWHFSGHGSVQDDQDPNRAVIQLADGQRFTPEQISGRQANLGRADPLVFFNACQIGRAGMSLTGLGGWARQFLHHGAAGFIGPMWNVHDNPARDFAQAFYGRLLEGKPIGAATLAARNDIKRYQDATWLAYTVYGHPSAAVPTVGE